MSKIFCDNGIAEMKIVCQKHCEGGLYSLYSLRIGKKQKLLIGIEAHGESDFYVADGERSRVERLYCMICEGELCCDQLGDVVADHNRLVSMGE